MSKMPSPDYNNFGAKTKASTPCVKRETILAGNRANGGISLHKVDTMTIEVMESGEVKHWKESSKMKDYLENIWGSVDGRGDFKNKELN